MIERETHLSSLSQVTGSEVTTHTWLGGQAHAVKQQQQTSLLAYLQQVGSNPYGHDKIKNVLS